MDVFPLNSWLLLGMLSLVILCIVVSVVVIGFGIDRSLKAMTQQLERDLQRAFAEIEKNTFEIRLLKDITLIDSSAILSESSKSSDNSD